MARRKQKQKKATDRYRRRRRKAEASRSPTEVDLHDDETFRAAIVTLGEKYLANLGFDAQDPMELLDKLGLPTENAQQAADELERLIAEASQRGPGRPRQDPEESLRHPNTAPVLSAMLEFLVDHPGAVYRSKERLVYSDAFKDFALGLKSEGGLAQDMTARQLAWALRMPVSTLTKWLSSRKP